MSRAAPLCEIHVTFERGAQRDSRTRNRTRTRTPPRNRNRNRSPHFVVYDRRMSPRLTLAVSLAALLCSASLLACAGGAVADPAPTPSAAATTAAPTASSAAPSSPIASAAAPASTPPSSSERQRCGELWCRFYPTAEAAFMAVVDERAPRVLALGEAHPQKGTEHVASTAKRFTEQLLPKLAGRASALVLELWIPDPKCSKEQVAGVQEKAAEVTKTQTATTKSDYVLLGEACRKLEIVPFPLRPSCDEYDSVKKAGDDAVFVMLDLVTKHMGRRALSLVDEAATKSPGKIVITYGGAMHNDVAPKAGREQYSFAAELSKRTDGRYVELDLIVPEYIKDTEAWRSLPWYAAYDREAHAERNVLIELGPNAYALVFARTPPPGPR